MHESQRAAEKSTDRSLSGRQRCAGLPRHGFGISGQGNQREILPVHVVHKVEHAWESRTGVIGFIPGTILVLRAQQISYSPSHAVAPRVAGGKKAHHRPCRLRRRAGADALQVWIVVGTTGFAPSAISVLEHTQPLSRLLYTR